MAIKIKLHRSRRKKDSKKDTKKQGSASEVRISDNSKFAIVEAYKSARSNIMFSLTDEDQKFFAVTSFSKGEGKSTVSSNLAISFSKTDRKVLVIDCDLRRPNIHNIFKVENTVGLSNVIGKMAEYEDVVHRNVMPNLDILTSGTIPPNPSELLCSKRFAKLIESVKADYDYIIFDTPPIGVVSDALLLKDKIAGYVLVLRERSTTHGDIQKMIGSMKLADAKILGFIKNGCMPAHKKYYRGYYKYYNYYYRYGGYDRYGYGYGYNTYSRSTSDKSAPKKDS